jgi:hypothetical protein
VGPQKRAGATTESLKNIDQNLPDLFFWIFLNAGRPPPAI